MEFVETEKRSESIARINSLAAASACGDKQALIDQIYIEQRGNNERIKHQ